MKTNKRKFGDLGESIACKFLMKRGFEVIERNYLRKWGEIDIVAKKMDKIHFVEVKTASTDFSVPHETIDSYRTEENIHPLKLARMARAIESYIGETGFNGDWQMDGAVVLIDKDKRQAKVSFIENINI